MDIGRGGGGWDLQHSLNLQPKAAAAAAAGTIKGPKAWNASETPGVSGFLGFIIKIVREVISLFKNKFDHETGENHSLHMTDVVVKK